MTLGAGAGRAAEPRAPVAALRRPDAPSRASSRTRSTEPEDVASLVAGDAHGARDRRHGRFGAVAGREIFPGSGVETDDDLAADLRRRVELLYHPVGTCRMGADDDAVVDPELRVRGVEGLRVADASVMPVIPGGNTNAPTIMIAERAADLVRGRVGAAA